MGRVAKLDRPAQVHVAISGRLQTRIGLLLFSDAHGRVPYGAMSAFYEAALLRYVEELEAKLKIQWKETPNVE